MEVTVTDKYEIVLPEEVREQLRIETGKHYVLIIRGETITLVPKKPVADFKGIFPDLDTDNYREKEDRI